MNEQIRAAAYAAARGEILLPSEPMMCLSLVRRVVEAGIFGGRQTFYDTYLAAETSRRTGKDVGNARADPWAADLESSMKYLGYAVPFETRQFGDLVFNNAAAKPYGHVGVLYDVNTVLENAPGKRPHSVQVAPYTYLTLIEHWPLTLVGRLQPR